MIVKNLRTVAENLKKKWLLQKIDKNAVKNVEN